ncbi:MAG: hypothetical protein V9F00_02220 [Nocardioides sp.]
MATLRCAFLPPTLITSFLLVTTSSDIPAREIDMLRLTDKRALS